MDNVKLKTKDPVLKVNLGNIDYPKPTYVAVIRLAMTTDRNLEGIQRLFCL